MRSAAPACRRLSAPKSVTGELRPPAVPGDDARDAFGFRPFSSVGRRIRPAPRRVELRRSEGEPRASSRLPVVPRRGLAMIARRSQLPTRGAASTGAGGPRCRARRVGSSGTRDDHQRACRPGVLRRGDPVADAGLGHARDELHAVVERGRAGCGPDRHRRRALGRRVHRDRQRADASRDVRLRRRRHRRRGGSHHRPCRAGHRRSAPRFWRRLDRPGLRSAGRGVRAGRPRKS